MRLLVLLAALITALVIASGASATPNSGAVLVTCDPATHAQVDPIVSFGVTPSDHDHQFFGSDQADSTTTYPRMVAGSTTCDIRSDKSLYWHPGIVKKDGTVAYPTRSSFYYRGGGGRGGPVVPFPAGIRFVSGDHNNMTYAGAAASWTCNLVSYSRAIPSSCSPDNGLQEDIYVSSCWDGKNLGAGGGGADNIGGTANVTGTDATGGCPPSHPIRLPSLQYIINWPPGVAGGRLTSDAIGASPGASAHIDFFNGWTFNSQGKDAMGLLTNECLNVENTIGTLSCRVSGHTIIRQSDGSYVTD